MRTRSWGAAEWHKIRHTASFDVAFRLGSASIIELNHGDRSRHLSENNGRTETFTAGLPSSEHNLMEASTRQCPGGEQLRRRFCHSVPRRVSN
jgi:hypothetical protein